MLQLYTYLQLVQTRSLYNSLGSTIFMDGGITIQCTTLCTVAPILLKILVARQPLFSRLALASPRLRQPDWRHTLYQAALLPHLSIPLLPLLIPRLVPQSPILLHLVLPHPLSLRLVNQCHTFPLTPSTQTFLSPLPWMV